MTSEIARGREAKWTHKLSLLHKSEPREGGNHGDERQDGLDGAEAESDELSLLVEVHLGRSELADLSLDLGLES